MIKLRIKHYYFNSLGYTYIEDLMLKKIKKTNLNNLFIKIELWAWKKININISKITNLKNKDFLNFLQGIVSKKDAIYTCYNEKIINSKEYYYIKENN